MFRKKRKGELTDEDVVKRIVEEKDHDAFGLLYDRYAEKVYHKCISFVKDNQLAQDLTHDVFVKTFLNLSKFSHQSKFSTWLYSITYNFCVDYIRKGKKMRYESDEGLENIADTEDARNEEELLQMEAQRLGAVLDALSPDDKMLLLMKYQDDLSISDIMNALETGESATKMRIKRAKAKAVTLYQTMFRDEG